jgi:hypothetical protein
MKNSVLWSEEGVSNGPTENNMENLLAENVLQNVTHRLLRYHKINQNFFCSTKLNTTYYLVIQPYIYH